MPCLAAGLSAAVVLAAAGVFFFALVSLPPEVISGDEVSTEHREILADENIIQREDEIVAFYYSGLSEVSEGGIAPTPRAVIDFGVDESGQWWSERIERSSIAGFKVRPATGDREGQYDLVLELDEYEPYPLWFSTEEDARAFLERFRK